MVSMSGSFDAAISEDDGDLVFAIVWSAFCRLECRTRILLLNVAERACRAASSDSRVCEAVPSAACCACRDGSAAVFCCTAWCRVEVTVWERVERRASFSGLGGTGGTGTARFEAEDRETSKGDERRSSWGGGACLGGGGCGCKGGVWNCCDDLRCGGIG